MRTEKTLVSWMESEVQRNFGVLDGVLDRQLDQSQIRRPVYILEVKHPKAEQPLAHAIVTDGQSQCRIHFTEECYSEKIGSVYGAPAMNIRHRVIDLTHVSLLISNDCRSLCFRVFDFEWDMALEMDFYDLRPVDLLSRESVIRGLAKYRSALRVRFPTLLEDTTALGLDFGRNRREVFFDERRHESTKDVIGYDSDARDDESGLPGWVRAWLGPDASLSDLAHCAEDDGRSQVKRRGSLPPTLDKSVPSSSAVSAQTRAQSLPADIPSGFRIDIPTFSTQSSRNGDDSDGLPDSLPIISSLEDSQSDHHKVAHANPFQVLAKFIEMENEKDPSPFLSELGGKHNRDPNLLGKLTLSDLTELQK